MREDKFPIAVSESGLHICIDGILTPKEGLELIKAVRKALFDYKALAGKHQAEFWW